MSRKWIARSAALFLVLAVGALCFLNALRPLSFEFGPLPKSAPTLARTEIERLLSERYRLVRHVRQIPPALRESFTNVTGLPFDMNNPGDPMSTDAVIHAPSRQLIFAGTSSQSAVVVYEQGSFVSFPCAVVLSKDGGAVWIAIDDYAPTDIQALRRTVSASRFRLMAPGAWANFTSPSASPGTPRSSTLLVLSRPSSARIFHRSFLWS